MLAQSNILRYALEQSSLPPLKEAPVSQTNITATEAPSLPVGHWVVDTAHSSIEFGIKHLLITTVKGSFTEWEGAVDVAQDGTVSATAVVRAESIDTSQPQRDEHLRSPDFFDTAS